MSQLRRPLMGTDNILDLQDNGYKSTVSAIAEIVDNSIQADATKVDIILVKNTTRTYNEIDDIIIMDNGKGMDEETFDKALQMSSGTRSNARSGLGKYGQGLPNSSISQTKRVEVYTIQNNNLLFNYIDLDEIYESREPYLPDIESVKKIKIPIFDKKVINVPHSGTIVRWSKPNRIRPKTAKTLAEHINKIAGRIFRHFLVGYKDKSGKILKTNISILIYDYNGQSFSKNDFLSIDKIIPYDPMFLMPHTQLNELFSESNHPTSDLFDKPFKEKFKIEYKGEEVETEVEIMLSYCRREERDKYGRNAGKSLFGKEYLRRNMIGTSGYNNISIVREGREIDCGSFGFIGDVSDPVQRWWSAEIKVEPLIDSVIGIDNKKQQATNIRSLDIDELNDPEVHEIIKWISIWLDANITEVQKFLAKPKDDVDDDSTGDRDGTPPLPGGGESEPGDPGTDDDLKEEEIDEIKLEFFNWIKERYPKIEDLDIHRIVDHALSIRDNHIFIKSDLGDTQLYSYKVFGKKVLIEINYNHSFYSRFMHQFEENPEQEKSLRSIRLLIGALVNGEIKNKTQDKELIKDRRNIKNRVAESLDDYIEDLYSGG